MLLVEMQKNWGSPILELVEQGLHFIGMYLGDSLFMELVQIQRPAFAIMAIEPM